MLTFQDQSFHSKKHLEVQFLFYEPKSGIFFPENRTDTCDFSDGTWILAVDKRFTIETSCDNNCERKTTRLYDSGDSYHFDTYGFKATVWPSPDIIVNDLTV